MHVDTLLVTVSVKVKESIFLLSWIDLVASQLADVDVVIIAAIYKD